MYWSVQWRLKEYEDGQPFAKVLCIWHRLQALFTPTASTTLEQRNGMNSSAITQFPLVSRHCNPVRGCCISTLAEVAL